VTALRGSKGCAADRDRQGLEYEADVRPSPGLRQGEGGFQSASRRFNLQAVTVEAQSNPIFQSLTARQTPAAKIKRLKIPGPTGC
jgi:hypothetical protein